MPKRPAWASRNFLPWPRQDHALNDAAVTYWIRNAHGAAALYVGKIMHARLKPFGHRFRYCVMSLLIDLDRLDEADRQSRLFGVNRAGACSFHEADRGPRDGSSLRAYAQACGQAHDIDLPGGRAAGRPTPVAQGCADRGALRQPMRHAGYSLGAGRNRG
jgi:hypothetical protein